jgi:hypothetical protein
MLLISAIIAAHLATSKPHCLWSTGGCPTVGPLALGELWTRIKTAIGPGQPAPGRCYGSVESNGCDMVRRYVWGDSTLYLTFAKAANFPGLNPRDYVLGSVFISSPGRCPAVASLTTTRSYGSWKWAGMPVLTLNRGQIPGWKMTSYLRNREADYSKGPFGAGIGYRGGMCTFSIGVE